MTYTAEQRDIIQRIGDLSARFDAAVAAHHASQTAIGRNLIDITTAMLAAINQTGELVTIQKQHGDAFREFLDTL
jgi:hypothetical protein